MGRVRGDPEREERTNRRLLRAHCAPGPTGVSLRLPRPLVKPAPWSRCTDDTAEAGGRACVAGEESEWRGAGPLTRRGPAGC